MLPSKEYAQHWDAVIDTAGAHAESTALPAGRKINLQAKSMVVLRSHQKPDVEPDHSVAASLAALAGSKTASPKSAQ